MQRIIRKSITEHAPNIVSEETSRIAMAVTLACPNDTFVRITFVAVPGFRHVQLVLEAVFHTVACFETQPQSRPK